MTIRRGDLVAVAAPGDYGKPRPAVVVQSDLFPETHPFVIICQLTSHVDPASSSRILVVPSLQNGLTATSQIMVDKPTTVRRSRIGKRIGRLEHQYIGELDFLIALVMGLGDLVADPLEA